MSRYVPFFRQREEKEKDERRRRKRKTRRTMPTWASARWLDAMCGGERRFALPERKADTTSEALVVIFLSEQRDDLVSTVCSTRVTDRVVSSPRAWKCLAGLGVLGTWCVGRHVWGARAWVAKPSGVVWTRSSMAGGAGGGEDREPASREDQPGG